MFHFIEVSFENYFVWALDNCAFSSQEMNELSFIWIHYPTDLCNW